MVNYSTGATADGGVKTAPITDLVPDEDNTRVVGTSSKRWRDGQFVSLKVGDDSLDVRVQLESLIDGRSAVNARVDGVDAQLGSLIDGSLAVNVRVDGVDAQLVDIITNEGFVESEITELKVNATAVGNDITNIISSVTDLETTATQLESDVKALEDKSVATDAAVEEERITVQELATLVASTQVQINPMITILGSENILLTDETAYIDEGATALDADGNNLTGVITQTGVVLNVSGVYTITYTVSDTFERTTSRSRKVKRVLPPEPVRLTASGMTSTLTNTPLVFTDSGGLDNNYQPSESYNITFSGDQVGTLTMVLNSCSFEHVQLNMFDRLGMQTSDDGVTYTNVNLLGFLRASNTVPPWGRSRDVSGITGYIFPQAWSNVPNSTFTMTCRYVRFYFVSDGPPQFPGWNVTLSLDN